MKKTLNEIKKILESGELSGYRGSWGKWFYGGEKVKELEAAWQKKFNIKHAIAVNSATSGIFCALNIVMQNNYQKIQKNVNRHYEYRPDEVIVTPYSMTCSASLPLAMGAKPIFADIEKDYFCIDPYDFYKCITSRTRAIIIVDLFGMPYDVEEINKIAKKYNIVVIEDAAQAIGAKYGNKYAGTLGDIGVFSLNQHKHIHAGEGGMITTDNDEYAFKLRLMINHAEAVVYGYEWGKFSGTLGNYLDNSIDLYGFNLRMTEITAAIALERLKELDKIVEHYNKMAEPFNIPVRENCVSSYYKYAHFDNMEIDDKIYDTKDHYITPIYKMPLFRSLGYRQNLCPNCEEIEKNIKISSLKEVKYG